MNNPKEKHVTRFPATTIDTAPDASATQASAREVPLTGPSLAVRIGVKPMTRALNPLIGRLAGKNHVSMAAQVRHRGRRSGRPFMTPVGAKLDGDTFWIPLTFGTRSDWCQNVRAAGGCAIRWKGTDYTAVRPVVVDTPAALSAARAVFKLIPDRAFVRAMGIRHFLRLDVVHP
jgi:deazaflavin-dependent oxidoreductase (nitroreductase family)